MGGGEARAGAKSRDDDRDHTAATMVMSKVHPPPPCNVIVSPNGGAPSVVAGSS